uniref:Uncharacterized protein n=1 Tax=Poecilia reticulata TaxID=8081 RepID=A0A3P9P5H6_POERE
MPGADAGNLTQAAMRFAGELLGVPAAGDALVAVTLGDADDVDHLVLGEDGADPHCLLQLLAGPVHLVGDGAAVQLHLHQVGLLLPQRQQTNLCVDDDSDDLALLLAILVLPFLAVLGEGLLLGFHSPVLVEAAFAFVAHVLGEDGLERAQAAGRVDVADDPDYDHGRSLHDGHGLHHFLLVDLCVKIKTYLLTSLNEGRQVNRLAGVILREALGLTAVTATPFAGQKAQGSVSRSRKLTVGLLSKG